jgi:hypothetical protein
MSERDAFGREKGEDTLADMGWSNWKTAPAPETPTPTPSAAPAPASEASKPTFTSGTPLKPPPSGPPWTPGPPSTYRRRRRVRGLFVPLFLIGVLAVGILGVTTVLQAGSDALDRFEGAVRDAVPTTVGSGGGSASGESLLRPAALKAALRKLPAGDIELLRVAPERINANVIVDGRMHVVQVTAGGEVTDVATPAKGSGDAVRVNANAPSRIAQTAAKRAGRRPGRVSYLVLMSLAGKSEWQLFFDDGLHFSASASGKKVRRVR